MASCMQMTWSEFEYFGCVFDESDTDEAKGRSNVANGRRIAGAIRSLVNARDFLLECARALHERLFVPIHETML